MRTKQIKKLNKMVFETFQWSCYLGERAIEKYKKAKRMDGHAYKRHVTSMFNLFVIAFKKLKLKVVWDIRLNSFFLSQLLQRTPQRDSNIFRIYK